MQGRLTPGEVFFLSDIRPLFFELPHLSIWPFANTWGMIWPNIVCFGDMYVFSMDNGGYVGFSLISIALFMRSSVEKRKPYIVSSSNHWRNRYYVFLNWVLFQEEALQNRILSTKHIAVVERSHSGCAKNNYLPVMSSISRGSLSGVCNRKQKSSRSHIMFDVFSIDFEVYFTLVTRLIYDCAQIF